MDTITPLLTNSLAALLLPLLLGVRALRKKFATSAALPTIHEAIITTILLALAMALAFAGGRMSPTAPAVLTDLWWVQGILFWIGLLITDAGMDATSTQTADAQRTIERLKVIPFVVFGALLAAAPANARDLPWLSLERLSGGVCVQGSVYSNAIEGGDPAPVAVFAPKAYLSYGVLDEISGHASYQLGIGAVRIDELHAGGAVRILREDPVRVSVGVDAVRYLGDDAARLGARDVTEYSLRFSKVLKRAGGGGPRLGIQFQPCYVPANENFIYRLGINAPWAFGKGVSE